MVEIPERGDTMAENQPGMCEICRKPGCVHITAVREDGSKTSRSFCVEHAPPEFRDKVPFGAHRTPAEEVAYLRQQLARIDQYPAQRAEYKATLERQLATLDQSVSDPAQRAEIKAMMEEQLAHLSEPGPDPAQRAAMKAELEQLIADIEAGRRRLSDAD